MELVWYLGQIRYKKIKMEKTKKWQLFVIGAVVLLTLYNILPTLFYYSKPLSAPITQERAAGIADQIATRVDSLEDEGLAWLSSFSKLIGVAPESIAVDPNDVGNYVVSFNNSKDSERFSRFLPRAGSYIHFVPAQLHLGVSENPLVVVVRRNIGSRLSGNDLFDYVPLTSQDGAYDSTYTAWVDDRAEALLTTLTGLAPITKDLETWMDKKEASVDSFALTLSRELIDLEAALGKGNPLFNK